MTTTSNWTIWGQPGCSFCNMAWDLLDSKGYDNIQYNVIGQNCTKEDFLLANPGKRSVPQIFLGNEYIGNYDDLVDYFNDSI